MKTINTILVTLLLAASAFPQISANYDRLLNLKQNSQLPDETQIKILIERLASYKNAFKYYGELMSGNYGIEKFREKNTKGFYLIIYERTNGIKKIKTKLKFIQRFTRNGNYVYDFENRTGSELVDGAKSKGAFGPRLFSRDLTIINDPHILVDQEILNIDPQHNYGKILNRTQALAHVVTNWGNPSPLFYFLEDGLILPFPSGSNAKMIYSDPGWTALVWMDRDHLEDGFINYGSRGHGDNQFNSPEGMAYGKGTDHGNYISYPVYIADAWNGRIVSVNFIVSSSDDIPSGFDESSFTVVRDSLYAPYDVAFFEGKNVPQDNDYVWFLEIENVFPALCYMKFNGTALTRIKGYKSVEDGTIYYFQPGLKSRLSTYDQSFCALVFIDNTRNNLVTCELHGNGTPNIEQNGDDLLILADDIITFPSNQRIISASIHNSSENTMWYPYLWVTSGSDITNPEVENMIHLFKLSESLHPIYLASTEQPDNSNLSFHYLNNTVSANYYFDLFTAEEWDNTYGLRRYLPFVDIYNDSLSNYCKDSLNYMKWDRTFTNDCWISLTAERQATDGSWQSVSFKKINQDMFDPPVQNPIVYRWAGPASSNIQLDLPLQDLALGGSVRLHIKLYPESDPGLSGSHIDRNYEASISKYCLPKPGGCPFVYVLDTTNTYSVDNNVLHRSEFDEFAGQDILDRYKLNIKPLVDTAAGLIQIAIVENEADSSQFDFITLHAIDHTEKKVLGITESNDYILYDPNEVISTDSATLNSQEITNLIQFTSSGYIKALIGDTIYSHYLQPLRLKYESRSGLYRKERRPIETNSDYAAKNLSNELDIDSVALIILAGNFDTLNPVTQKNWAGGLNAVSYDSSQRVTTFARRENPSELVIPLFSAYDYLEKATINVTSDAWINYIATVPVTYPSSLTVTGLYLQSGMLITRTAQTDVTTQLSSIDQSYAMMDGSAFIQLQFVTDELPTLPDGWVRDYVVEVNGKYFPVNSSRPMNLINNVPLTNRLYNNFPNPFNPKTRIKYEINKNIPVKIIIYNILGQEVKVLVNEFKNAGRYEVDFDGTNYASGVYFYRIEAGSFIDAKKMVLIK